MFSRNATWYSLLSAKELEKGNISILKEDEKLDYYDFENQECDNSSLYEVEFEHCKFKNVCMQKGKLEKCTFKDIPHIHNWL